MLAQPLPVARPPAARARLVATAALERNAKALNPKQLVVERQIGEGSFGQVFLASACHPGGLDSNYGIFGHDLVSLEGQCRRDQPSSRLDCRAHGVNQSETVSV
jgi:hypothetical protein